MTFIVETPQGAFLYASGGVRDMSTPVASTEVSALAADGSVGAWNATSNLNEAAIGGGVGVVGQFVVIAGGLRANSFGKAATSTHTSTAVVADDGAITNWEAGPELATSRFHGATAAVGNFVYVLGGLTGDGKDSTPEVEMAVVTDSKLGPWQQVTPYPERRSHQAAIAHGNKLYSIGGLSGNPAGANTTYAAVWRTEIQADGSLSAWQTVSELPTEMATHSAVVHADSLYVIGGVSGQSQLGVNTDAVYRAHIQADGGLSSWETQAPLPKARAHAHQTPEHGGFIYSVAGAFEHASMTDVFVGVLQ